MEPVTPVSGDGYDLGDVDLGLEDSPKILEHGEDDTEDLQSRFQQLLGDPASPEPNVEQDPYGFQSPCPSRQPIFSPLGGLATALKAPH